MKEAKKRVEESNEHSYSKKADPMVSGNLQDSTASSNEETSLCEPRFQSVIIENDYEVNNLSIGYHDDSDSPILPCSSPIPGPAGDNMFSLTTDKNTISNEFPIPGPAGDNLFSLTTNTLSNKTDGCCLSPVHIAQHFPLVNTAQNLSPVNTAQPLEDNNFDVLYSSGDGLHESQDNSEILIYTDIDDAELEKLLQDQSNVVIVEENVEQLDNNNNSNDVEGEHPIEAEVTVNNEGRPKKGRKRKYDNQTRKSKKQKVNTNQDYINVKGEVKYAKDFHYFQCNCKLKCTENVSLEQRQTIFTNFQNAGSYEARSQIIQGMVRVVPIKRKRVRHSDSKPSSREYYLNDQRVCKTTFTQTLRTSSCVIDKALKLKKSHSIIKYGRGSAGGHNRLPEQKVKEVIDHISKFPKYESHYCRSTTDIKFLHPDMTVKLMHKIYSDEHENPVTLPKYKEIFLKNFNLRRKPFKKDTCNLCDKFAAQTKSLEGPELELAKIKQDDHLKAAEDARKLMNKQFEDAKKDETKEQETLSFDLEKTLPLPRIPTNIVYYKRQLCFYNLGVHNSQNKGFCYTWVEGTAGRGAQEIGSCLRQHIYLHVPAPTKHLNLWSDSCGGQNRNIKLVLFLKTILESHPSLEKITQHFLVPGHSFLRNDSDFSDIEKALKTQQRIYLPSDYESVISKCRTKNPLKVQSMKPEDFLSTKQLEKAITNRKKSTEGDKVNWLKIRVVEVRKEKPMSLFVKTELNQESFEEISVKKKGRQSHSENNRFFSRQLQDLWPQGKPISTKKLEDLKSMFSLIPKDCQAFYKQFTGSDSITDDIEGFGCELDFEVEEPVP